MTLRLANSDYFHKSIRRPIEHVFGEEYLILCHISKTIRSSTAMYFVLWKYSESSLPLIMGYRLHSLEIENVCCMSDPADLDLQAFYGYSSGLRFRIRLFRVDRCKFELATRIICGIVQSLVIKLR